MEGPLNFPPDITFSFTTCCHSESLLLPNGLKGLRKKRIGCPMPLLPDHQHPNTSLSGVENEKEFSEGVDDIRRPDHNKKGAANGNR